MKGDGYHMIAHLLLVPKSIVEHVNILKRLFSFFGNTVRVDRDLKQRRRRRQRELQRSNRLRLAKKKNQICTCITLFCTLLCRHCTTTTWNSTCYGGRELKTMTFFFFFWTSIQSFRIQLQKKKKANIWRIEQVGIITINFEERDVTF